MLKNYLIIGLRTVLKYKVFSFINVFGLAVSLSICLLIILMLADQKRYDRFHKKKDRVFRVLTDPVDRHPYATTPAPLAEALSDGYTNISLVTQLVKGFGGDAFYQQNYAEMKGYFTDSAFFEIFDFELAKGDPGSAMALPNSMVITAEVARKLFKDEDPMGKVVNFSDRGIDFYTEEGNAPVDWGDYKITGVLRDVDYKTHLKFDVLVSINSLPLLYQQNKFHDASQSWNDYSRAYTYILLPTRGQAESIELALEHLAIGKFNDYEYLKGSKFLLQSLTKISPGPMLGNDPMVGLPVVVYYIFLVLLMIIVGSACINYTNLSIARAVTRFKEIGVRKVNGAKRKDLVVQFLCESLIMSLLVLGLAFIFLFFIKSAFLKLWLNQHLNFELNFSIGVLLLFSALTLAIVVGAGLIPAIHLSGYKPIKAFGNFQASTGGRFTLRKILTVSQFVVSLLFIVTTLVVLKQFNHYMTFEYGFNPNQVVNISLQSNQYSLVRNAFMNTVGVDGVAGSGYLPGTGRNDNTTIKKAGTENSIQAIDLSVDENFLEVMEIGLVAGRNLPPSDGEIPSVILVNEQAAKDLGYKNSSDLVGEIITEGDKTLTVAGVFDDITFFLLFSKKPTGPIVLRNDPARFNFASIKIASNNYQETIGNLEGGWKKVDPIHPLKYEFYQEKLAGYNRGVFDLVTVMGFFAFVAITIACLGLLGISIYTTERRTKEIGIRKVLGARRLGMALLLSKDYLKLLAISILIAGPFSFYINRLWLDTLVVRAPFNFGTVLLGASLLLALGILFIGPQTLKIAGTNPVDTLKNE